MVRMFDGGPASLADIEGPTLVLVHGFNSTYEDVFDAYAALRLSLDYAGVLKNFATVVNLLWPGGDKGALSWIFAQSRSNRTGQTLPLELLGPGTTWLTHSLGARVALSALRRPGVAIENLIMLAPAVDDEEIADGGEFAGVFQVAKRIAIFHSEHDPVLKLSYPPSVVAGHTIFQHALGETGKDHNAQYAANILAVNCSRLVHSHGGYRAQPDVARMIGAVVDGTLIQDVAI